MKLLVGTSGFAYKEWKGSFYPEKMKNEEMLGFYSERFQTVEINNTFYRAPNIDMLAKWKNTVPQHFMFTLKASRRITHNSRLRESCQDTLAYVLKTSNESLEKQMGPTLFQLPPNFKKDAERLEQFIGYLPEGTLAAFEFRNLSWFDDEIYGLLQKNDIALCYADGEVEGEPFKATANWGYLRLRKVDYDEKGLQTWVDKVKAQDWKTAYVYFKHEDEGTGPELANKFLELHG